MKVDDLIVFDNINLSLDGDILHLLQVLGFAELEISLAPVPKGWACIVKGTRADGSQEVWVSPRAFKTPEGAHNGVIAVISGWILNQPIPAFTP